MASNKYPKWCGKPRPTSRSRQSKRKVRPGTDSQKKTKWDVIAVVIQAVALAAIPITLLTLRASVHQFNEQQAASAAQALNQQRQTTLDNYFNDMSNLLLNYDISEPKVDALAVARTDTAVRNLDGARKGILVRYLWEANLITAPETPADPPPVVTLFEANLNGANFQGANLYGADLGTNRLVDADFYNANLSCFPSRQLDVSAGILIQNNVKNIACTNLSDAILRGANLRKADLIGADLRGAQLSGAHFKGATYNSRPITVRDAFGKSLIVPPTQWPRGYHAAAKGVKCVYC